MKRRVDFARAYREPMVVEIWQEGNFEEHLGVSNRTGIASVDLDGTGTLSLEHIIRYVYEVDF